MPVWVGADKVVPHHLAKDRLPFAAAEFPADAESGQLVVPPCVHLVGRVARQNIDQMPGTEVFAAAQYRRQSLTHGLRAVDDLRRAGTQIAIPAWIGRFAEIPKQHLTAAAPRLCQAQQGVEPRVVCRATFRRRHTLVNLRASQADIVSPIKGQRVGRRAIATGAADLLIIGLYAFGQIGMGDPADIRLVDAHAEGDGCDHDQTVLALKPALDRPPVTGIHAAMIGAGVVTRLAQGLRQGLGLCTGTAIDDAGLVPARRGKDQQLLARAVLGGEGEVDIRPVEAVQENPWRLSVEQPLDDLGACILICGGGKGGQRDLQRAPQLADAQIVGPEIVSPLTDTMGLVHRDQPDADAPQKRQGACRGQAFRRHVEQPQATGLERLEHRVRFLIRIA